MRDQRPGRKVPPHWRARFVDVEFLDAAGLLSEDVLTVDAALVAENGRIGRFYYGSNCTANGTDYHVRSTINLNGMIATNNRYGFAYTDNTGYQIRNITYDSNLLYAPPPSFPAPDPRSVGWVAEP